MIKVMIVQGGTSEVIDALVGLELVQAYTEHEQEAIEHAPLPQIARAVPEGWDECTTITQRVRLLLQHYGPMRMREVVDAMDANMERDVSQGSVSAALSTLKAQGELELNDGQWSLVTED